MELNMDTNMNTNLNTDNNIQIFEEIASNSDRWNNWRQCREMIVPPKIDELQPGQYCELYVVGGGYYCQWYYYQTIDNRHMLIFRTPIPHSEDFTYSGRGIDERPKSFGSYVDFANTRGIPINFPMTSFEELMDIENQLELQIDFPTASVEEPMDIVN